jgi:nicotinamide-nucleotide amidase
MADPKLRVAGPNPVSRSIKMMRFPQNINVEIITIGDEILIGQIVDTNSAWLAQQLNDIGINIFQITSISDNKNHIINALDLAYSRVDLILVTGGLGPTRDDITKQTIAEYFQTRLVRNEQVLEHIQNLLSFRGVSMNDLNVHQADVPESATVIQNDYGTAPCIWMEKNDKVFVFMPGVPFEMKGIVSDQLLNRFKQRYNTPAIVHKTLMLQGIPESQLALLIEPWELQLPPNIKLAYLPVPGLIKLRLTAKGDTQEKLSALIDREVQKVMPVITEWYYGEDEEPLEITIAKLLKYNNKTLATAESCTGGKIASLITTVPGSSTYFKGSIVAYANEVKTKVLGVKEAIIREHGAVSKETVEAMALGVRNLLNTDYSIATSGIAGPDGGSDEKPVGTVWIAVASEKQVIATKFLFGDNRERNIIRSSITAMNELRKLILLELQ